MKKYRSLFLAFLLFVLLSSLASCTQSDFKDIELAIVRNEAAGVSMMPSTMTVYSVGSAGTSAVATYVDQNMNGEDVLGETTDKRAICRIFSLPTVDGATEFLPVSNNPADDARTAAGAQVAGEENLGAGKFKSYVQSVSASVDPAYLYDYYEDESSKGLAAISFSFTIPADPFATDQTFAIKLEIAGENAGQPGNWAVATSADGYAKVYQGQSKMYVAVDFTQSHTDDTIYTVWVWLNGCAHQNSQVVAANDIKFTFALCPYNSASMALPTVEAPTLNTFEKN